MGLALAFAAAALALFARPARAQEPLADLLARGHAVQWLVCGPFDTDLPEGVAAAAARGVYPVGDTDFMAPLGGILGLRPRHLLSIARPGGDAIWQRAGTEGPVLDLAPFFPGRAGGVAYAAFYVQADAPQAVALATHSLLGARLWVNDTPMPPPAAARPGARGIDRVAVRLAAGLNLVVLQVPGADFAGLAAALGTGEAVLAAQVRASRPLLRGDQGYAFGLAVRPLESVGGLHVESRLEAVGTVSGTESAPARDMRLAVYRLGGEPGPEAVVRVRVDGRRDALTARVPALAGGETYLVDLPIPLGAARPGDSVGVRVTVAADGAEIAFDDRIEVPSRAEGGAVAVVAGPWHDGAHLRAGPDGAALRHRMLAGQTALAEDTPDYGFNLGHGVHWLAALARDPGWLDPWRGGIVAERIATLATYAPIDERMVHGEVILRNFEYGLRGAAALLGELRPAHIAWDLPGVAPQTPQWIADAGLGGLVANGGAPGLAGIFAHAASDGTVVPHRHKMPAAGPASAEALRQLAAAQRRPAAALGIALDVLPLVSALTPPEPFMRGAAALERSVPAVRVDGGGAHRFFERLPRGLAGELPAAAPGPARDAPGGLLDAGAAAEAHALATRRVLDAEKFATLAALLGARYPGDALDLAWRHLLHAAHPARLAARSAARADTQADLRHAAELADGVLRRALDYIAMEADTLGSAPADTAGARALVVFNPAGWTRDDLATAEVALAGAPGLALLDDRGDPVPFWADRIRLNARREITGARLRFVARGVPGIGYRTYHVVPRGNLPAPVFSSDPQIANDLFVAAIDPATGDLAGFTARGGGGAALAGRFAQVAALPQDPPKAAGAGGLWTAGSPRFAAGGVDIRTSTLPGMQQSVVTAGFAGGRVVREYIVADGLPGVLCTLRFEGYAPPADTVAAVVARPAPGARAAVFGERFGVSVGALVPAPLALRGGPRGDAPHPAWDWAAITPNDALRIGADRALPLQPALVLASTDLLPAANAIVRALAGRGVPAFARVEDDAREPAALIDDTPAPAPERFDGLVIRLAAAPGAAHPAVRALDPRAQAHMAERLSQGAAVLAPAPRAEGAPPAPMIVLAGADTAIARRAAEDFARDIARTGAFPLPPSAVFGVDADRSADAGVAVLFSGPRLAAADRDGALAVLLGRAAAAAARDHQFSILPFAGEWRDAAVPAAAEAHATPFIVVDAPIRSGRQPGAQRLIGADGPGVVIASLRPAADGRAGRAGGDAHPNDGILVRAHEPAGRAWRGSIGGFFAPREAAVHSLAGRRGAPLAREGRAVAVEARPFGVAAWWIAPDTRFPHGPPASIAPSADAYGPAHPALFARDSAPAPWGHLPLALAIDGGDAPILRVANLDTRGRVEGVVTLQATPGASVGPERVPFALGPGRHLAAPLDWSGPDGARLIAEIGTPDGGLRAVWPDRPPDAAHRMERTLAQIKVTVENNDAVPLEGWVDLVVPHAHWPELGGMPRVTVLPARAAVSVLPGRTQDILFRVSDPDAAIEATPRLVLNGWILRAPE